MTVIWSERFAVGVKEIDAQHKQIADLVNVLQEALGKKDASNEIKHVLASLVEYTQTHFAREEVLMAQIGFPALGSHAQSHARLVAELRDMLVRIKGGEQVSARRLYSMLRTWWSKHIEGEDMQYVAWMRRLREAGKLGDLSDFNTVPESTSA